MIVATPGYRPPPSPEAIAKALGDAGLARAIAAALLAPFTLLGSSLAELLSRGDRDPSRAVNWTGLRGRLLRVVRGPLSDEAERGARRAAADIDVSFELVPARAIAAAEAHAAELVTGITDEARQAVRAIIVRAQREGRSVNAVTAEVRSVIGLNPRYAAAVANRRRYLERQATAPARIEPLLGVYRSRLLDVQSRTIARTELARSSNLGTLEGHRQAVAAGAYPEGVVREWITAPERRRNGTPDARTCATCRPLNGVQVPGFDTPWATRLGPVLVPPAHPNCLVGSVRVVVPGDEAERLSSDLTPFGLRDRSDARSLATTALAESLWDETRRNVRAVTDREYVGDVVRIELRSGHELTGTPNHPIATPSGWVALSELKVGDDVLRSTRPEWETPSVDPDVDHVPPRIEEVAEAFPVLLAAMPTAPEDFHGDGAGSEVCVVRADGLLEHDTADAACPQHGGQRPLGWAGVGLEAFSGQGRPAVGVDGSRGAPDGGMGGTGEALPLLGAGPTHPHDHGVTPSADVGARLDKNPTDRLAADTEGFCERLLALSQGVATSDVVRVVRMPFRGHVYNLDTVEGWYIGNGILTHNCRCRTILRPAPSRRSAA